MVELSKNHRDNTSYCSPHRLSHSHGIFKSKHSGIEKQNSINVNNETFQFENVYLGRLARLNLPKRQQQQQSIQLERSNRIRSIRVSLQNNRTTEKSQPNRVFSIHNGLNCSCPTLAFFAGCVLRFDLQNNHFSFENCLEWLIAQFKLESHLNFVILIVNFGICLKF